MGTSFGVPRVLFSFNFKRDANPFLRFLLFIGDFIRSNTPLVLFPSNIPSVVKSLEIITYMIYILYVIEEGLI